VDVSGACTSEAVITKKELADFAPFGSTLTIDVSTSLGETIVIPDTDFDTPSNCLFSSFQMRDSEDALI